MTDERRFRLARFLRGYWRAGLAIGTALGLLNFTYFYLDDVTAASTHRSSSRSSKR